MTAPDWLTLDAVVATPRPGTTGPTQFAFSPDGRWLTYLWSERSDPVRDLWIMDVQSGARRVLLRAEDLGPRDEALGTEETLRRERQRVREGGITQYQWAKVADRLLIPHNGQLYVTDSTGTDPRHVAPAEAAAVDARLTPDGTRVVLARAGELWAASVDGGTLTQLTFDSTETLANGVAEFIAQEEMGRSSGFWIAPDAAHVAYAQVDEGHIPTYPIVHQAGDEWRVEQHRYPFAGAANARVRLGVVPLIGGATTWLDLGPDDDYYLARVDWQDSDRLLVQVESRDQQRLELRAYQLGQEGWTTLLVEETRPWVNLHSDLRVLADGSFIWASERTGNKHLELRSRDGGLVRTLTSGEWLVDSVLQVNESARQVYFTAGKDDPRERNVLAAPFDGGEVWVVAGGAGFHGATFAGEGTHYVHSSESQDDPPSSELCALVDGASRPIHAGGSAGEIAPGLRPPELVELQASDGTRLYGALYRPQVPGPWPLIVAVYGGPHAQMVTNTWGMTIDLRAQYLASRGFAVFKLDNRGAGRRGLAFEGPLHRRMGTVEVEDQVAGVRWLAEQRIVDPNRVGIYGWSYGGYMSAMCLLKAPDVFRAAAAGAPVSAWDGYDTHYTERYMDTPASNPDGYREASLMTHIGNLKGRLLIIHGLVDENVHFRHSARLIAALELAGKPFELLLLPEERHGVRPTERNRPVRRMLEERIATFFEDALRV